MFRLLPFLLAIWSALAAAGEPARPRVVVLLPTSESEALRPLALLLAARASEVLEASSGEGVVEVQLRQALRALEEEGLSAALGQAERLAALVGADRALAFELRGGPALSLRLALATGGRPALTVVPLGASWSGALTRGGLALATALLGRPPEQAAVQPDSRSDEALRALGTCWAIALRQPLAVETPALLDAGELGRARAACRRALTLDPSLRFASAVLALVEAIAGDDAAAVERLQGFGPGDEVLEPATLARFWLLTRYQSNAAGEAFLRQVVSRHPLELLPRATLGETLLTEGAFAEAEAVWRAYAELSPRSSWALGRLSKAMARQGRHDQAVELARRGLALSGSRDARLELGSRLIDAGQAPAAVEVLRPLAALPAPRAEHLLRLGYAIWLTGDFDGAAPWYQRALDLAVSPAAWRTRGRALHDLAMVELKRGRAGAARDRLRAALRTGYQPRSEDPVLAALQREPEGTRVDADAGQTRLSLVPQESSLFPLDAYGEPDPAAPKPPPPAGLILFTF
jgi:tetratricopeptide (TPR) repeat protein